MNVLTIVGNLGRDAEVRNAGGTSVAGFSVAMTSGYGEKKQTIWVDCSLWGKQAESALPNYLKKGQQVSVSGEMGTREYEGKTYITLRVSQITLCGSKSDNVTQHTSVPTQAYKPESRTQPAPSMADLDDAPF